MEYRVRFQYMHSVKCLNQVKHIYLFKHLSFLYGKNFSPIFFGETGV
jgi:hypothetical protein